MQTITIVIIIGFAIIMIGLILTEIHNHQIEVSVNRQEKRYRFKENCDMIPDYRKKYIHLTKSGGVASICKADAWQYIKTENHTGKTESLDDFIFVFRYQSYGPQGELIKYELTGPTVTAEHDEMIHRFKEIKEGMDREIEPYIINYH